MYRTNDDFEADLDLAVKLSDEFTAAVGREISFEWNRIERDWELHDGLVIAEFRKDLHILTRWAEAHFAQEVALNA